MFTETEINLVVFIFVVFGVLFLFGSIMIFIINRSIKKDELRIRKENREHMKRMENL